MILGIYCLYTTAFDNPITKLFILFMEGMGRYWLTLDKVHILSKFKYFIITLRLISLLL